MLVLSLKLCLPVLLGTASLVSAHANMIDCKGDKGGLIAGLGFNKNAPLGGNDLNAVETDAVKFNNLTVQFNDCGVTNAINNETAAIHVDPTSSSQVSAALSNAGSSQLPQVSSSLEATWLTMVTDGGGFNNKVRALLDTTGTGNNFDTAKPLNVQGNVNGNNLCNVNTDGTVADNGASITATAATVATAAPATAGTKGKGKGNKQATGVRRFVGSLIGRGSKGGKTLGKRAAIILDNGSPNKFKLNIAVPPGTKCTGPGNTCVMRVDNKVDGNECANFFGSCIVFQMADAGATATNPKAAQTNANAGSKGAAAKAKGAAAKAKGATAKAKGTAAKANGKGQKKAKPGNA